MAGTTGSPFNWPIPDDNDFLKAGWDSIADLAMAIQATVAASREPIAQLRQAVALGGTITASTWTSVLFDTADKDTHTGFVKTRTGGTSDSRWTCPSGQGGTYQCEGAMSPASAVDQAVYGARIAKNAVAVQGSGFLIAGSGTASITAKSKLISVDLTPGDYVELQAYGSAAFTHRMTADGFASTLTVRRIR